MHIYWYGLSSFKIVTKDVTIFTDPFGKAAGPTPPRGAGSLVIVSDPESELANNTSSISGEPFIIDGPGEYDVKGVVVRGIPEGSSAKSDSINNKAIYTIGAEGIHLGFLGNVKAKLTDTQLEDLNDVNILLVPVGNNEVMDAETAVAVVNQLEPNVVIPMYFKTPGITTKLESADKFIKEVGAKAEEMDKLLIKASEFTEEKTRLVLLKPQR